MSEPICADSVNTTMSEGITKIAVLFLPTPQCPECLCVWEINHIDQLRVRFIEHHGLDCSRYLGLDSKRVFTRPIAQFTHFI